MEITKFNIRVYGILLYQGKLLLTDEHRLQMNMTKFPGGGLEFGEGTIDCLKREFREELNLDIRVEEHLYTTDFFQPTRLVSPPQQLISIYYKVNTDHPQDITVSSGPFDFTATEEGAQSFRWADLLQLNAEELTFPIDRKVVQLCKEKYT